MVCSLSREVLEARFWEADTDSVRVDAVHDMVPLGIPCASARCACEIYREEVEVLVQGVQAVTGKWLSK